MEAFQKREHPPKKAPRRKARRQHNIVYDGLCLDLSALYFLF